MSHKYHEYLDVSKSRVMDYIYSDKDKKDISRDLLAKIRCQNGCEYIKFQNTLYNILRISHYIFSGESNVSPCNFFDGYCLTEEQQNRFKRLVENKKLKIDDHVKYVYARAKQIQKKVNVPFHKICKVLHILTNEKPKDIQKLFEYTEEIKPINNSKLKVNRHD